MYNIPKGTSATPGNELAIFESIADVYAQEDLDLFFSTLARYVSVSLQHTNVKLTANEGTSQLALTPSSKVSTVVQPQLPLPVLVPNQTWTSKSRTRSSGLRTPFSSSPMTWSMRTTTPSRDS
jgi:tripeptidyl-peptidase-1